MNVISDSFFFQVMRMRKAIFRKTTMQLMEAGIQLQMEQLPILVILLNRGVLSQRELSDMTLRDKSSILRSVSSLQKKGLLIVKKDSTDKRKNNIDLNAAGKDLARQIGMLMLKAEDNALSVFPEDERAVVLQTIKNYADTMEEI